MLPQPHGSRVAVLLRENFEKLNSDTPGGVSARAAMLVFAIRLGSAFLAFIMQVFLARWMGSTQYGAFVLVWVAAHLTGVLVCSGLQISVVRFITEYRARHEDARLRGILVAAPIICVSAATLVAMAGFVILENFSSVVTDIYVMPFYLALICLPLLALEEVQDGIARSFNMPVTAIGPAFIVRPLVILFVMSLAYHSGFPPTATTALYAAIIATFAATALQAIVLWVRVIRKVAEERSDDFVSAENSGNTIKPKLEFEYRRWAKVSLPIFLSGGFYYVLVNMDVLFIGYFTDPQQVAIYFAALKILALAHFVHFALRSASAHHFSRYFTVNDMDGLSQYANKIARWTFWPTLLMGVVIVLFGKYALAWFGDEFVAGQTLLVILVAGILIRAALGPVDSLLSMAGQQNIAAVVWAITLACNLVLNFALIPPFGIVGAAVATFIAIAIESAALYVAVNRTMGLRIFAFASANVPLAERSAP